MPLGLPPVVALLVGLVHCIAGYKLFPLVLGIYGLVFGVGAGAAMAEIWFPGQVLTASLMQVGAGLLGLGAVLAYFRIGVFVIGAVAALLLTWAVAPVVGGVSWQVQLLLACVAGSASVVVSRVVLIVATAITGAALVVRSAEVMAESPVRWLTDLTALPWTGALPDAVPEVVAWAALALLGIAVQLATTARH
ncbi:protein of unknown function [Nannocystis exedens]|uniref:TM7S3/TM198-like domain-containing protein n=1 Tax=Nannocystis exedens TaxID=54 RepID=A0A1I1SWC1_9BACT|nr:DUF4203 domain-containing protein [Nannocystis exedens]PCC66948.1 hypothetical protein NAEX_09547 [Nannocystis exedens]SFD50662.1 protein of unknown function [Nannocystis exedens]